MSTAVGTPQDRPRIAIGRVTQLHVIRSEWTKLWSLRSTRWSLLVAVVGMAGLGITTFLVAGGKKSDAEDACPKKATCDDERSEVRTLDAISLDAFIAGEPIKPATNRLTGLLYSSLGAPTC